MKYFSPFFLVEYEWLYLDIHHSFKFWVYSTLWSASGIFYHWYFIWHLNLQSHCNFSSIEYFFILLESVLIIKNGEVPEWLFRERWLLMTVKKELFFLGGYEKTFCLSCVYVEPCKYLKIPRNGFYHYAMDSPLFKVKKRN